jgi:hypothetical protein
VILGERELRWQAEVAAEALRHGWTVYGQTLRNERHGMPSLVLVRERVILAYLRTTTRADRRPPVEDLAAVTGAEAVLWTPADWSLIVAKLAAAEPPGTP